jgi:chromate transport protein ChrA
VLFYGTRKVFEGIQALGNTLGLALRRVQCLEFTLMRLSNATIATAVMQMLLPAVTGVIFFPLYQLANSTVGRQTAMWTTALYPLVPSFVLWVGRWERWIAGACFFRWVSMPVNCISSRFLLVVFSISGGYRWHITWVWSANI